MSDTMTALHDGSQEGFAKTMLGLDPALLQDDAEETPAAEADAEDTTTEEPTDDETGAPDVEPVADDVDGEAEPDGQDGDGEQSPDNEQSAETAEKPTEATEDIKLPFSAVAKDAAVDAALLKDMQVKFKADGEEITIPLADVVRRAQSEPAVQRQARQLQERVRQVEQDVSARDTELASVREIALRMARDPEFYAQVVADVEQYDLPEARAARAEEALAERSRQEKARQELAERTQRLEAFAANEVAPVLSEIVSKNALVTQEEIFGKFVADTAGITVNGVIPPEYHESVARYLRTTLADFASQRQAVYAERDAQAKAEALKTQRERQRMKNTQATNTKPAGDSGGLRGTAKAGAKPTNINDAQKSALDTLVSALA